MLPNPMDRDHRETMLRVARSIAASGFHPDWRGVEAKMQEVGYADAQQLFADPIVRSGIEALCAANKIARD